MSQSDATGGAPGTGRHTPQHTTYDASQHGDTEGSTSLDIAAEGWTRRGYRVRYRDTYLIQLFRRDRPGRASGAFVALALAALAVACVCLGLAIRRRPWHVVTLVRGPEGRILTHHQHAPRPPAP